MCTSDFVRALGSCLIFCVKPCLRLGTGDTRRCLPAHFFTIPLLTAPARTLRIDQAGTGSAASFVVLHGFVFRVRRALHNTPEV